MHPVVLKCESIILIMHMFISKLLPLVIVGVGTIVVRKVSVIAKIGNNKMYNHDNRNIKANGISLL